MPAAPRKPVLVNLTWAVTLLLALALLYVLSYAPLVRLGFGTPLLSLNPYMMLTGPSPPWPSPGRQIPAYAPVDWLIDYTPAQRPLLWWSGLWGVRDAFENSNFHREVIRRGEARD
jgi:hypothetical protein